MASSAPIPPSTPARRRFTMDLLERKAKFGFIWFVAHGGLNTRVRRGRYKKIIMTYDTSALWKELKTYYPDRDSGEPMAIYTVSKLTTLAAGLMKLANYRMDYILRNSLSTVDISKQRRVNARKKALLDRAEDPDAVNLPNPVDEPFIPEGEEAEVPEAAPRKRRRRRVQRRGSGDAAVAMNPVENASPHHSASEEEAEGPVVVPPPRPKRLRRAAVEVVFRPSDTQVLRLLSAKAAELNLHPRANLMIDPELPSPRPLDTSFYDELGPIDQVADQATFLNILNTGGQGDDESGSGDPTDQERAQSRRDSARTPRPSIGRGQGPPGRRPVSASNELEQNSMELAPILPVALATPRPRRSRRLVFLDAKTTMSLSEIQRNVLESRRLASSQNLTSLVRQTYFWPPSEIQRKGLEFIEQSGRTIPGRILTKVMGTIKTGLPVEEELRGRPIVRVEGPSEDSSGSALNIEAERDEPSAAPGVGLSNLEATATRSISESGLAQDVSRIASAVGQPGVDMGEEGMVQMSLIESPPRGLGGNDENGIPPPGPATPQPAEQLLTFAQLVPPGSKRELAVRVFMGLLNNQKKGNVELIQNEWCGEIRIRILKPDYNPLE